MRKLLIGIIVLAALLVAADRISVAVAENQISDRITSAYGLAGEPGVTITGFPFLTQVVTGDYRQIDVSVSQVLGNGSSMVTADRAAGSAMAGFSAVNHRLPGGFRLHPDGKNLSVSGRLAIGGARIPVSATVALGVSGPVRAAPPVHVSIPGVAVLPSAYSSQLHVVVPLSTLRLHLRLTSVHVTPDGLRIGAAARHVQFART